MLTDHRQADGVTEDRAGVDLTLVLPGVREGHVPDDQLPLPPTEVLPHRQPRVLEERGKPSAAIRQKHHQLGHRTFTSYFASVNLWTGP